MTTSEKLKAIKEHQKCKFVHPLTCGADSSHMPLLPRVIKHNKIVLVCPTCGYMQQEYRFDFIGWSQFRICVEQKKILDSLRSKGRQFTNNSVKIAMRILSYMVASNINKNELALRLNKTPELINKWLSGEYNFKIETLSEIEAKLRIVLFVFNEKE